MLQRPSGATKALLDLADYFDRLDPCLYNQSSFARCICGHCNQRAGRVDHDTRAAARELGLTYEQAKVLFDGGAGRTSVYFLGGLYSHTQLPTSKDAAACLRHLAVTGDLPETWARRVEDESVLA